MLMTIAFARLIGQSDCGESNHGGRVMRRLLGSCVGVFCAAALVGPALADEPPPVKRQRAAAPERVVQRAAPAQQGANWSGGQVGGSNGVSSVNNNFVDPGAFVCPFGSTFGSNCFETPFQFN